MATIAAALVAVPVSYLLPLSYTSTAQVLIPARDPVMGNDSRAGTSVVALRIADYASRQITHDVRQALNEDASILISLRVSRERNPIFFRLTSTARSARLANRSLDVAAVLLIEKTNALAEEQIEALSEDVLPRIEQLRSAEAPLRAQESAKQTEFEVMRDKKRHLEGSLLQAGDTVDRARITGGSASASAAQAVAADLQKEIEALNPLIEPLRAELEVIQGQLSTIVGQRERLEELLYSSTQSYVSSRVASVVSEPPLVTGNVRVQQAGQSALLGGFAGLVYASVFVVRTQARRAFPGRPTPDKVSG